MRSLAREESEESPEESDLKKLASVTAAAPLRVGQERTRVGTRVERPTRAAVWPAASSRVLVSALKRA